MLTNFNTSTTLPIGYKISERDKDRAESFTEGKNRYTEA